MNYVISLIHTRKHSEFITLWRPQNAGYCYSQDTAGLYETPQDGYHNSDLNMSINKDKLDKLFIETTNSDQESFKVIPNCKAVWNILGLKMTNLGLRKRT